MSAQRGKGQIHIPSPDSPPPCGPATLTPSTSFSTLPAPPSSPPEEIAVEWRIILEGLADPDLFPAVDWRTAERAGSLVKVQQDKGVKALSDLFSASGLPPSIGYNVGSGEVSFTFAVPVENPPIQSQQHAVLWTMLGLSPMQEALEAHHATASSSSRVLANSCLEKFSSGTSVGLSAYKICGRTSAVKAVFGQAKVLARERRAFTFSPSYVLLSGLGSAPPLPAALAAGKEALVDMMVAEFWTAMDAVPYAACDEVQTRLTAALRQYLASGVLTMQEGFSPAGAPLSLYTYGSAGTGKSTLVSALAKALQEVLRRRMDPVRRVDVVKVPLNFVTPHSLASVLKVQGISDWSIERIVEQSICKGHTVVIHLEEVPQDPALQDALFTTVRGMVDQLSRRYPKQIANVAYIFTSNYPPGAGIAAYAESIRVLAPSAAQQAAHCARMLEERVREQTGAREVEVELQYVLAREDDMRPRCQWWTTLSFLISQHVSNAARRAGGTLDRVSAVLSADEAGRLVDVDVDVDVSFVPNGSGGPVGYSPARSASFGAGAEDTHIEADAGVCAARRPGLVEVGAGRLSCWSEDGFFFLPRAAGDGDAAGAGDDGGAWQRRKSAAVVDMCRLGALKPAVIVLTGTHSARQQREAALLALVDATCSGLVQVTRVALREESDKEKVSGHQSQIRGGLFKVIDDMNNENGDGAGRDAEGGVCVVVCEVNEVGQFMLRELLENGESRTHRQAVRKDRVLFILSMDEGVPVQAMTLSRAHDFVAC